MENDPRATAYGPDALKVMGKAFDKAWDLISPVLAKSEFALAREMLADAILAEVTDDFVDADQLANRALKAVAHGTLRGGHVP